VKLLSPIRVCHWRSQDFVLRGPENRGAVGAESAPSSRRRIKASSGEGNGEENPGRKRILVHFELEKKTNLMMTNLTFFVIFIGHIYISQIYKASFDIFFSFAAGA